MRGRLLRFAVTLALILLGGALAAEGADSASRYVPPPEEPAPLLPLLPPEEYRTVGLASGVAGVAAGITVSILGIQRVAALPERGFESPRVQSGIILTATGMLFSSLSALIVDWFLPRRSSATAPPRQAAASPASEG